MGYQGAFVYRDRFDEVYEFEENSIDFELGLRRRVGEAGRYGALFNFLKCGDIRLTRRGTGKLRQAEVQKLRSGLGQHDVRRLEIAVHHSLTVCFVKGIGDLNRVPQRLFEGHRSFLQTLRQRLPLEVLHDEEVHVSFPADVMERADLGVVQTGNRSRFSLEALAKVGITRKGVREGL